MDDQNSQISLNGGWKLNKNISLSTLIHLSVLLLAIITMYFGLKNSQDMTFQRMGSLESRQDQMQQLLKEQQDLQRQMDERLARMEGKLDTTISSNAIDKAVSNNNSK